MIISSFAKAKKRVFGRKYCHALFAAQIWTYGTVEKKD